MSCFLSNISDSYKVFEDSLKNLRTGKNDNCHVAISSAINIINQYRFRNGTDNIGRGWAAWYS